MSDGDIVFTPEMQVGYRPLGSTEWQQATVTALVEGHLHLSTTDPKGITVLRMSDPDFWNQIGTPF